MENYKQQFIEFLVQSKALKFGEFTLKSGRKCPYFLNLGQFCTGESMKSLSSYYAAAIQEKIKVFDVVFGPAYKGIPLCVGISMALYETFQLNKAYAYNRKEPKDHGEGGLLVGAPLDSESKIVIVDDVMTAGTALREVVEILRKSGNPQIVGVMIAVDRMEKGKGDKSAIQEMKEEFGIEVHAIVTVEEIFGYLKDRVIDGTVPLDEEKMARIKVYREQYGV